MRTVHLFAVIAAALLLLPVEAYFTEAEAAYRPRGKCAGHYATWRRKEGAKAFATSRNGRACGFSTGYPNRKRAVSVALRACRKHSRSCRVISSRAALAFRFGPNCRKLYRDWRGKPGFGAFILRRNGACNANWNANSEDQAVAALLKDCKPRSSCRVRETKAPDTETRLRQRQLAALGLYKGPIDGDWGRGSKAAMNRFMKTAGLSGRADGKAYDRLTWAKAILDRYEVDTSFAIEASARAVEEASTQFLAGKQRVRETAALETPQTAAPRRDSVPTPQPTVSATGWTYRPADAAVSGKYGKARCILEGPSLAFVARPGLSRTIDAVFAAKDVPEGSRTAVWKVTGRPDLTSGLTEGPDAKPVAQIFPAIDFWRNILDRKELTVTFDERAYPRLTISLPGEKKLITDFLICLRHPGKRPPAEKPVKSASTPAAANGAPVFKVKRGRDGHFRMTVRVNGVSLPMMADTGATHIAISRSTARKAGLNVEDRDFRYKTNTANGVTTYAKVIADEVRVGPIVMRDVIVGVLRDSSLKGDGLLGNSFLSRLEGFSVRRNVLTLEGG